MVQDGIDKTIQLVVSRRDIGQHVIAVAQMRDAMMAEPNFTRSASAPLLVIRPAKPLSRNGR